MRHALRTGFILSFITAMSCGNTELSTNGLGGMGKSGSGGLGATGGSNGTGGVLGQGGEQGTGGIANNDGGLGSGGSSQKDGGLNTGAGSGGKSGAGGAGSGGKSGAGGAGSGGKSGTGGAGSGGKSGTGGADGGVAGTGGTMATGPCAAITFTENTTIAKKSVDRFVWQDANCLPRSAAMARYGGGYVRQFTYQYDGKTRTATGTDVEYLNLGVGWGYTVNHDLPGGVGLEVAGTFKPLFIGEHHAIYEYKPTLASDIATTQHWFFATGRDNPIVAVTFDVSKAAADKYEGDSRTPYGDIAWDGDENKNNTVVSGVGWGDRYKFKTTKAPLTMNSTWDYTESNLVPYCMEWADASDAEMGAVQTQTWQQHDAGGYWHYSNWGKTSANQTKADNQTSVMPLTWNWTYQLNQYELCGDDSASCHNNTTGSHRLAWGANYGAVGQRSYPAYGDDKNLSGYPYQSYAVFMVLGKHGDTPVLRQVGEIETVQKTTLSASVGKVATQGPGGVGRTDRVTLAPAGYDHRYSTWNVDAADNRLNLTVAVSQDALPNPVLVVSNFTGSSVPTVMVDGITATENTDFLASLDTSGQKLWLTFRSGWSGTKQIEIR